MWRWRFIQWTEAVGRLFPLYWIDALLVLLKGHKRISWYATDDVNGARVERIMTEFGIPVYATKSVAGIDKDKEGEPAPFGECFVPKERHGQAQYLLVRANVKQRGKLLPATQRAQARHSPGRPMSKAWGRPVQSWTPDGIARNLVTSLLSFLPGRRR